MVIDLGAGQTFHFLKNKIFIFLQERVGQLK
jgi:hypothetical protein